VPQPRRLVCEYATDCPAAVFFDSETVSTAGTVFAPVTLEPGGYASFFQKKKSPPMLSRSRSRETALKSFDMEELFRTEEIDTVTTDPRDADVGAMLLVVLRSLVDKADELHLVALADAQGVCFQVRSSTDDLGKLIGKGGHTARAIRTILSANAAKHGRRYSIDLSADPRTA
jgi:predicted RNA-binding protein YlqC (UPF0109 family)